MVIDDLHSLLWMCVLGFLIKGCLDDGCHKSPEYNGSSTSSIVEHANTSSIVEHANGPYETYHENGQLREKGTIKDGKKDGPYEKYYKNGQLWEKGTIKDGEYDGPYESYLKNGVRKRLTVCKMGRILQGQEAAEYRKEWEAKQIKIPYLKFPNINDGR